MAIQDLTKPMALDETLQATNDILGQIRDAMGNQDIIGDTDISEIADGTLTGAVAQFNEDINRLDTDKADKVSGATSGNLAGLDASGNLTDAGWTSDKTTTSATGNPISISGLKSNQLAINPVITFEPIQAGSGTPSPVNQRPISGYDKVEVESCGKNIFNGEVIQGRWSHTDGTWVEQTTFWATKNPIPVIGGQSNYISNVVYRAYYDKNMIFISGDGTGNAVVTTPANAVWMHITQAKADWSSPSTTMVAISNTAITYVPYVKATSISESLGQTQYWLEYDVRSGKAKIKGTDKIDLGSLSWTMYGSGSSAYFDATHGLSNIKDLGDGYCECYKISQASSVSGMQNGEIRFGGTKFFIKDTTQTSASDLTTALNGKYAVAEFDVYGEIQLTPHEIGLLKDYAYLSTNGTNISLDYHNGEIASLADVSQVGETVNELLLGINDTGEFQLDSDWTGTADVYRLGKMVMLNINIHKADGTNFSANTNYEIGKLPIGYTTRKIQFGVGIELTSNVIDVCRVMVRNSNNRNVLVSTSSAGTYIQCTMIYWIIQ